MKLSQILFLFLSLLFFSCLNESDHEEKLILRYGRFHVNQIEPENLDVTIIKRENQFVIGNWRQDKIEIDTILVERSKVVCNGEKWKRENSFSLKQFPNYSFIAYTNKSCGIDCSSIMIASPQLGLVGFSGLRGDTGILLIM